MPSMTMQTVRGYIALTKPNIIWLLLVNTLPAMVLAQGGLGYAIAALMGPIVVEIFEGKSFGTIFSVLMTALIGGGAVGPFVTGVLHDRQGDYVIAWWIALALSVVCAVTVYLASPGKVRMVAGKVTR